MNAESARPSPNGSTPASAASPSAALPAEPNHKGPARILVVDDDPDVRRVLGDALQLFNYRVDTAGDGAVGWEALCANSYDLVITDHMMPNLTGLDLLRLLRAVRLDLPCLLISGDLPSVEADLAPLLQPGLAVDKPVKLEKLISLVRSLLSSYPIGSTEARTGQTRLTLCPA